LAEPKPFNAEVLSGLGLTPVQLADAIERLFAERAAGRAHLRAFAAEFPLKRGHALADLAAAGLAYQMRVTG